MPMKHRNYKQERKTMLARGEQDDHTERLRLRRKAAKAGLVKPHDDKDLAHKKAISKGETLHSATSKCKPGGRTVRFPATLTAA